MISFLTELQTAISAILNIVTQIAGALISVALLPLAAAERAMRWLMAQSHLSAIELHYYKTQSHMTREARHSTRFLNTYLREYSRLVAEFREGNYQTLQEAQIAYVLFKLAEADLMARAHAAAGVPYQQYPAGPTGHFTNQVAPAYQQATTR